MNIKLKLKAAVWLFLTCICILFSIICFWGGLHIRSIGEEKLFALSNGERTVGTIVSDEESIPDSSGGTSSSLHYRFTLPSGAEIEGTYTSGDSGFLADRTLGNPIEVAYNPAEPTVNVPTNVGYHGADPFVMFLAMILGPLMGLAFSVGFGYKAWQTWKESLVFRH
jgi:hypothetical protein